MTTTTHTPLLNDDDDDDDFVAKVDRLVEETKETTKMTAKEAIDHLCYELHALPDLSELHRTLEGNGWVIKLKHYDNGNREFIYRHPKTKDVYFTPNPPPDTLFAEST